LKVIFVILCDNSRREAMYMLFFFLLHNDFSALINGSTILRSYYFSSMKISLILIFDIDFT
jgi:hypothetical protein